MNIHFPKSPEKNIIEKISIEVAHHDIFIKKIPLEATISYPIPVFVGNKCMLGYFHYLENRTLGEVSNTPLNRPLSTIIVDLFADFKEFNIISCEIAAREAPIFGSLADPSGESKQNITRSEQKNQESVLYLACETIVKLKHETTPLIINAYHDALLKLEWPGLIPFYKFISPEFTAKIGL